MRIVLDTNVVISGFLWGGPSRRLIESGFRSAVSLLSSEALVGELARTLERDKFSKRMRLYETTPEIVLMRYRALVELVIPATLDSPVCRDPDDDIVISTGIAANADFIVSGDHDLLVLASYAGIRITSPSNAVTFLRVDL